MALSTLVVKLVTEHGELIKGLDTAAGGVKKFVGDTQKSIKGLSLTDLKSGFELVGMAAEGLGTVYNALVGDTMEYAKQTRDLAENLGISAEETSSLIQVADDAGLSVDTLTSSMEMAVKKGFKPTVENLANLADEYNSISDPIERAKRLNDIFGKGWADLTPLLKEGGDAMRDAADEAKALGLTLTDIDVAAARQLEIEVDNLGDKLEALKLKVGKTVIPVLNEAATTFGYLTEGIGDGDPIVDSYTKSIAIMSVTQGENSVFVKNASKALQDYLIKKQSAIGMTDATDRAVRRESESLIKTATANAEAAKGMAAYNQARIDGAASYLKSIENEATLRGEMNLTKTAMGELTTATLYAEAAKGLDSKAALELGLKLGLISSESVDALRALGDLKVKADTNRDGFIDAKEAAQGYVDEIVDIAEKQKLIERNITVTITTNRRVGGEVTGDNDTPDTPSRATGGPTGSGGLFRLHPNEYVLSEAMRLGRVPIPAAAIPAQNNGAGIGQTTITNVNLYDTLTAKMFLEQQRAANLRRIAEKM